MLIGRVFTRAETWTGPFFLIGVMSRNHPEATRPRTAARLTTAHVTWVPAMATEALRGNRWLARSTLILRRVCATVTYGNGSPSISPATPWNASRRMRFNSPLTHWLPARVPGPAACARPRTSSVSASTISSESSKRPSGPRRVSSTWRLGWRRCVTAASGLLAPSTTRRLKAATRLSCRLSHVLGVVPRKVLACWATVACQAGGRGGRHATKPPTCPHTVYNTARHQTARSRRRCREPRLAPDAAHRLMVECRIAVAAQPVRNSRERGSNCSATSQSPPCPQRARPNCWEGGSANATWQRASTRAWSLRTPPSPSGCTHTSTESLA
eukprot:7634665-Pyramimonas_sp.AAC.1